MTIRRVEWRFLPSVRAAGENGNRKRIQNFPLKVETAVIMEKKKENFFPFLFDISDLRRIMLLINNGKKKKRKKREKKIISSLHDIVTLITFDGWVGRGREERV